MSDKSKHTLPPYHIRVGAREHDDIIIDAGDVNNHLTLRAVAGVFNFAKFMSFIQGQQEQQGITEANAAFIVTACNAHERFLSLLKFALESLTQETAPWLRYWHEEEPYSDIAFAIQDAEGIKPQEPAL